MYAAVPRIIPACVACSDSVGDIDALAAAAPTGSIAFARPKSRTFTVPSARTLILAGFRSRWMMPCSCAASSASAICFAMGNASSSGIAPTRDALREIVAVDKFHHESGHLPALFEAVYGGDIRMVQRSEHFRFTLKASQSVRIRRQGGRQNLDGDLTFQLGIGGTIHLPHAAFTNLGGDLVDAETGAGGKGQNWRDYTGGDSPTTGLLPGTRRSDY